MSYVSTYCPIAKSFYGTGIHTITSCGHNFLNPFHRQNIVCNLRKMPMGNDLSGSFQKGVGMRFVIFPHPPHVVSLALLCAHAVILVSGRALASFPGPGEGPGDEASHALAVVTANGICLALSLAQCWFFSASCLA